MTSASLKSNDQGSPTEAAEGSPAAADRPDFLELLGCLSDAISIITVVHHSLEAEEIAEAGDEEATLRHGLTLLRAAYSALDLASLRLG
jgi:hypothetical protein